MTTAFVIGLVIIFLELGCASLTQDTCPTIAEEPVSICRARAKCTQKKISYGVGLGPGVHAKEDIGRTAEQSPVTDKYLDCINRELEQQRSLYQIKKDEEKIKENL